MRKSSLMMTLVGLFACAWVPASAQTWSAREHIARSRELYAGGHYAEAVAEAGRARSAASALRRVDAVVAEQADLLEALSVAQMGDGTEALATFVSRYPSSPYANEALEALASEYYEWGQMQKAVECFERVDLDGLPDQRVEKLCFECGHAYYRLGEKSKAREWLSRVSESGPRKEGAHYLLGYMAYDDGLYAEARRHFVMVENSEEYGPVVPYYILNIEHRLGNDHYVVEQAPEVIEGIEGSRVSEVRRIAAQSAFRTERWGEAVAHIEALVTEDKMTLGREENYIAGYSLYRLGQWERAALYLRGACGPEDSLTRNAAYHLADCLLRWGDKRGAMQCFSMAYTGAEESPMREDAHYNYCKLQVEMGGSNFNEEIQTLSSFLKTYPRSSHRTEIEGYLISACYAANDLKGAYAVLSEAEGTGGQIRAAMQRVAYYHAAECYSRGLLAEAEEYCGYALDRKEYDTDIEGLTLYLLGEIDYSQGKYRQAASMYDRYLAMELTHQSEYPRAMYNMGYANFNASRYTHAYDDFRDFVEEHRTQDSLWADAYNRMGDAKAASKEYSTASKLYGRSAATQTPERHYGAYRVALMEGMAGNTPARIEALEKIVDEGKGNYAVRAHYELGNTLLTAGSYTEAVGVLEEYVAKYKNSRDYVTALADLALAYRNTGNDEGAMGAYKQIVTTTRGSLAAHNALGEIRNIYIERNDVDGFFAWAESVGVSSQMGSVQRDSLSFVAAQRLYIAGDRSGASSAFAKYLADNPEGIYSAAALYYSADCLSSLGDTLGARSELSRLVSMYYNPYTQRGYERLAQLAASGADWKAASEAYERLAEMAATPAERRAALEKYLTTAVSSGDGEAIIVVCDKIAAHPDATSELQRKALFEKAGALESVGKRNPAVAIYNSLSKDVTTVEGAESSYRIIETAFKYGSFERAEELVYEFADKNTPHAYWLAKSFLLLGDVYASRGDLFQARATYQSVVDGYSGKGDGIVEAAQAKIEELNN